MLAAISFPNLGFSVDPSKVALTIGGFSIYWYGIIIAIGFTLAVLYAYRRVKEFGISQDDLIDGLLVCVPLAIVGARLYYVLFHFSTYFGPNATDSVFDIHGGGLAIYGGVIFAVLGIFLVTRYKKHKIAPYLDVTGLGLLIGQAIGRWGNFINREAFGRYTDSLFAMRISLGDAGRIEDANALAVLNQKAAEGGYPGWIQVHPTFLYESVWNLVGFAFIHYLSKRRKYDGQVFLMYLFWYGLGRVWVEGLRVDSLMLNNFRVSQVLAGACVLLAGGLLLYLHKKPHDPNQLFVNQVAKAAEAKAGEEIAKAEPAKTEAEEGEPIETKSVEAEETETTQHETTEQAE